jgi:hypothetical protein
MLPIGRYGTAGRGLSIALVSCYLFISAIQSDASRAHELGGVLRDLRTLPGGVVITAGFALAFISSSILDFVGAVYQRFDPARRRGRSQRRW